MCIFSLIILSVYLLVIALQLMDVVVLVLLLLIYYHLTSLLSLFFLLAKLLYISKFGSVRPFILRVIFVFAATLKDLLYILFDILSYFLDFSAIDSQDDCVQCYARRISIINSQIEVCWASHFWLLSSLLYLVYNLIRRWLPNIYLLYKKQLVNKNMISGID